MIKKLRKSFVLKVISVFMLLVLVFQVCSPTVSYALTSGPAQPEVATFSPIGSTDMVDPFSGDFSYNIPLLTVPGPNGGYPIGLHYNGGAGVEQEASWVGLGWNINPGVISRGMRGMPDDFNGDKVNKQQSIRPNVTVGIGLTAEIPLPEIFGIDLTKTSAASGSINLNYQMYYNNYRGLGHKFGMGLTVGNSSENKFNANIGLMSFDSNEGIALTPSLSLSLRGDNMTGQMNVGFNYSSRQGFSDINFSIKGSITSSRTIGRMALRGWKAPDSKGYSSPIIEKWTHTRTKNWGGVGAGMSMSGSTGVPSVTYPMGGLNLGFSVRISSATAGVDLKTPLTVSGNFSTQYLQEWAKNYDIPAYGYNYTGERITNGGELALMDYSREKNYPIHQRVPHLPIPQYNNDIYAITGEGISGGFRPYRNDYGQLYNPTIESYSAGAKIGLDLGSGAYDIKVGVDISGAVTYSYSGKWKEGADDSYLNFNNNASLINTNDVLDRNPYYYKVNGEFTAVPVDYLATVGGENAIRIPLSPKPTNKEADMDNFEDYEGESPYGDANIYDAKLQVSQTGMDINNDYIKNYKDKSVQSVRHSTRREKEKGMNYSSRLRNVYTVNSIPSSTNLGDRFKFAGNQLHTMGSASIGGFLKNDIGHHIGDYSIVNPDGTEYTYGIPVYNISESNVAFAVDEENITTTIPKTIQYDSGDNSNANNNGEDYFFSKTTLPPYATNYLLTEIKGADYVDRKGDGLSDDDYGYYTKFNYSTITANTSYPNGYYKWRTPHEGGTTSGGVTDRKANYNPGYLSNKNDDKASYAYGEKEIWYLNSIETKTHIAVFTLSDREDGLGVQGENGLNDTNLKLKKLDKISLYSKNEIELAISESRTPVPIKSVHFEYSYDLCGKKSGATDGVANNSGAILTGIHPDHRISSTNPNVNKGKLTLKKVYFKYKNNDKGSLSPYYFDYNERNTDGSINYDCNPGYSMNDVDRWGNYKANPSSYYRNNEYPYVIQKETNKTVLDKEACVWTLREITLPSGGKIKVEYEVDDYGYVQDKVAGQMTEIIGTGRHTGRTNTNYNTTDDELFSVTTNASIDKDHVRLYFTPDQPLPSDAGEANLEVKKYIDNLNDGFIYFKTYQRMAVPKGIQYSAWAYDYVEGYAKVANGGYGFITNGSTKIPYVVLEKTPNDENPIRMAGWQSMRYQRSDLTSNGDALNNATPFIIFYVIGEIFSSLIELFGGYYNSQLIKGNCSKINKKMPNFMRLSTPDGRKYGGGYRVKSIKVTDQWSTYGGTNSEYGQKYFYINEDGTSSGVASYEPLLGGEEISLRKPHYYGADNLILNDPAYYLEEPFGESYFPGASVGYGRVVVENLNHAKDIDANPSTTTDIVLKTSEGIQVTEFYTAKDFPVIVEQTQNTKQFDQDLTVTIPLIGSLALKSSSYSQGYKIEVNDMHGQLRSQATYDADTDPEGDGKLIANSQPVTKTENIYQTVDEFSSGSPNRLFNQVDVLYGQGVEGTAIIGENYDFFGDQEENYNFSIEAGGAFNIEVLPPIFVPSGFPSITISDSKARIMVTNKIIYKNGVLKKTITSQEGAQVTQENLMWDAETGNVLLSRVSNQFNDNVNANNNDFVYSYSMPTHWAYEGMSGAYKNYRNTYKVEATSLGWHVDNTTLDWINYLHEGDLVMIMDNAGNEFNPSSSFSVDNAFWVAPATSGTSDFRLMKKDGTFYTQTVGVNKIIQVLKPGRTNQQTITAAGITSLQNPVTTQVNPFITNYNLLINGGTPESCEISLLSNTSTYYNFCFKTCQDEYKGGMVFETTESGIRYVHLVVATGALPNIEDPDQMINYTCFYAKCKMPSSETSALNQYDIKYYTTTQVVFDKSGSLVVCPMVSYKNSCLSPCLDGVLNASASDFTNVNNPDNIVYNYNNNGGKPTGYDGTTNPSTYNKYLIGETKWRPLQSNTYMVLRKQYDTDNTINSTFKSYNGKDGTFKNFSLYIWKNPAGVPFDQRPWVWTSRATLFSPYSYEMENMNPLGIYSSALFGYSHVYATAVANNASPFEIGYEGFEEYKTTSDYNASSTIRTYGNIPIVSLSTSNAEITKDYAHSGDYCLKVPQAVPYTYIEASKVASYGTSIATYSKLSLLPNKEYYVSAWIKVKYEDIDFSSTSSSPGFDVQIGNTLTSGTTPTYYIRPTAGSPYVDGWVKVEGKVNILTNNFLRFVFKPLHQGSYTLYFDDIRVQPFNSSMKTYAYNPNTGLLSAEMDENNFATFYNYDEEGHLVQIKKETEKGVMTIQSNRSNTKR